MPNIEDIKKYKHVHMIGIGGISMSGIAETLNNWGFKVTGSDTTNSPIIENLINKGVHIKIGHNIEDLAYADVVVYSAAIKQEDPEMVRAHELGIPTVERSTFLGLITKAFKDTICISGTHGKTTTTSMISLCFLEAFKDPTIQVGAILNAIHGNNRVGNSEFFIMEACEYVESFLKFFPKAEVILNIDNDHLDYYKTLDNVVNAFVKYVKLLPAEGVLVVNADDINCRELVKETKAKTITYSLENDNANFIARNIHFNKNGFPSFDVYHNSSFYKTIQLSIPGIHNVSNALACIALCDHYGIGKDAIKSALQKFTGAHRRFEFKGTFKDHGIPVYDDYGHHPTEIMATAKALSEKTYNKSWVVFQPHTYSRTYNLLEDFAKSLMSFDHIIVTDIYAARETNTYNISSRDLVKKLNDFGKNALYISNFNEIVDFIKLRAQKDDIVLTLGAGTVTDIGPMLVEDDIPQ